MGCALLPFRHITRITLLLFGLLIVAVRPDEDNEVVTVPTCMLSLAQLLFLPQDSLQVQALKRDLLKYLEERLDEERDDLVKRSLSSLVRDGKLPFGPKRNLDEYEDENYVRATADDLDRDDFKRSIANLAKNGQLPNFQKSDDGHAKRSIESLARNGELHSKRELDSLLAELYNKRNLGSLARGYNFPYPIAGKRYIGALARTGDLRYGAPSDDFLEKRNIASIVRNSGKRNVASLVRGNNLPSGKRYYLFDEFKRNMASIARTMGARYNGKRDASEEGQAGPGNDMGDPDADKRNIASLKSQMKSKFKRSAAENTTGAPRTKRQAEYWVPSEEYSVPVYQNNNVYDYEELMHALTGEYPNTEKRFLGSVAKSGWFQPSSVSGSGTRFRAPSKRHIGALARLGWLPALRSARRFNRSGRSAHHLSRSDPSDGSPEDNTSFEEESLIGSKRYLLLPAVDNILLRKLYSNIYPSIQDSL